MSEPSFGTTTSVSGFSIGSTILTNAMLSLGEEETNPDAPDAPDATDAHNVDTNADTNTDDSFDDCVYKCGICHDLLYRPVTLTCQHNYCYKCIEKYYNGSNVVQNQNEYYIRTKQNKCPLCNIPYTLAPIENTLMTSLLLERFPNEYKAKAEHYETVEKMANFKNDFESNLRKEIWNTISTNFDTTYPPNGMIQFINTPVVAPTYSQYWTRSRHWEHFTETLVKALPLMGSGVVLYAGIVLVDRFLRK